jgi:hypothetical protein
LIAERLDNAHDPAVEVSRRDRVPLSAALEKHDLRLAVFHDVEKDVSQGTWRGFSVHSFVPSTALFDELTFLIPIIR